uniref:Uncharacterized protein n=1 Tax=viral metagenome TaxID=1070528 RepID=A0A6M3IME4_9ZZZZ
MADYSPAAGAASGLTILDAPAEGYVYTLSVIGTPLGDRVVAMQVPAPPPPTWWEAVQADTGSGTGEGVLGAVLTIVLLWGRIRDAWTSLRKGTP